MTAYQLTAERLRALAELYQKGQTSDLMDRTLAEFEQQYNLSSEKFYRHFQMGQIGDDMDFVEWASLVQMVENLKKRLQVLQMSEPR